MKINIEKSKNMCELHSDKINKSECYDNVWRVFPYVNYDVMFCYIQHPMLPMMYVHHCVFVENEDVIDPTFYIFGEKQGELMKLEELEIIEIKRLNREEYLNYVSKAKCTEVYFGNERTIELNLNKNNKFILG